jgi:spore germination cell wall hydrolase CwlJ-like protein
MTAQFFRPGKVDDRALDILARTIWGEARGEPREGQIAVAHVVKNRTAKPGWWGHDMISVCQARDQFSCWRTTDPNRPKLLGVTISDPVFVTILKIARNVIAGELADPTDGATSYHTLDCHPAWDKGLKVTARIGNHIFYKE